MKISIKTASKNTCFPKPIIKEIESYKVTFHEDSIFFKKFRELYENLSQNGNSEKFYSAFYGEIVLYEDSMFSALSCHASTFLATKIADCTLASFKKRLDGACQPSEKPLTAFEKAAMHFLGGYVFHNLYRKLKNSNKWNTLECQ